MFEVSKKESVDQIYSQIQEELRNQYSLGYTPDRGGATESGYHKIQVAVKQKDIEVQARAGHYGEPVASLVRGTAVRRFRPGLGEGGRRGRQ